jgi:competence protein ComEA
VDCVGNPVHPRADDVELTRESSSGNLLDMSETPHNPDPTGKEAPPFRSAATYAAAVDVTTHGKSAAAEQQASALAALREAALRAAGVLPHPGTPAGKQPRFWLRRTDQLVVGMLLTLATALMTVHWARTSDWGRQPVEIDRLPPSVYEYRVDINCATWVEWTQLEGIGETLARRIVADREQNGPFRDVDDVLRVRGIGRVRLNAMRPHLIVGDSAASP